MTVVRRFTLPIPIPLNQTVPAIQFDVEGAEAALRPEVEFCTHLLPAMAQHLPLQLSAPLDSTLNGNTERIMNLLDEWFPTLSPVSIEPGPCVAPPATPPTAPTRTALFFTGGVDSFHTLLRDRELIDALVIVIGFDLQPEQTTLCQQTIAMARDVAAHFGKELVVVTTNLRTHFDTCLGWGKTHGAALAAVSHLLAPSFGRTMISSSFRMDQTHPWGTHPDLDPLWSSSRMSILHRHAHTGRVDKIRELAADPFVLRHLRVCWKNTDDAYNCGRCPKCIRTRFSLDLAGAPPDAAPFATPFDPALLIDIARTLPPESPDHIFIPELAEAFRTAGRTDDTIARALLAAEAALPSRPEVSIPLVLDVGPSVITTDAHRVTLTAPVTCGAVRTELHVSVPMHTPPPRCGDAHAVWFLLQAMRSGCDLRLRDPVSADLLAHLDEAQAIIITLPVFAGLRRIRILADHIEPPLPPPPSGHPYAAAFGGGIDGWCTLLQNRDTVSHILHLHGIDQAFPDPTYKEMVSDWLRQSAERGGVGLIEADTNLRQVLVIELGGRWDETFSMAPYGLAHLLQPMFAGFRLGSDLTYNELQQCYITTKYHPLLAPLLSSSATQIITDGMDQPRHAKAAWLAAHHPWVPPLLQVCTARITSDFRGGRNCGVCEKCLRTLAAFRMCGALELAQPGFDAPFDLTRLATTSIPSGVLGEIRVLYHLAMLNELKTRGTDAPLQQALAGLIARSRAAWPCGPQTSITDPIPHWTASPAWPSWVHDQAAHLLDRALPGADPTLIRNTLNAEVLTLWPTLVRQMIAARIRGNRGPT
jgi:7-cyano-7-deazaguanine synthase in queuosine biosynthesis